MGIYNRKDHFYQKAKDDGYASRSAYKLIELDKKFSILKPGSLIIDLGCSPGGWLKVASDHLKKNPQSLIVGIDLKPLTIPVPPACHFIQGDFTDEKIQKEMTEKINRPVDWVLSDMAPSITGIHFRDALQSTALCEAAFYFAQNHLKIGGGLIVKIFPGAEMQELMSGMKKSFQKVTSFIPDATRKTSKEVYLVGKDFRKNS